jgi:hypothetical protein
LFLVDLATKNYYYLVMDPIFRMFGRYAQLAIFGLPKRRKKPQMGNLFMTDIEEPAPRKTRRRSAGTNSYGGLRGGASRNRF